MHRPTIDANRFLLGVEAARSLEATVLRRARALRRPPRLALFEFASFSSAAGTRRKIEACARTGIYVTHRAIHASSTARVVSIIENSAREASTDGVFVPYPLPPGLNARACFDAIPCSKDVDGLSGASAADLVVGNPTFAPATARAVMILLDHQGFALAGRRVVVFHASEPYVRALHLLLHRADTNVEPVETSAQPPKESLRAGDIVIACGPPGSLRLDRVPPDLVVIDACYGRGRGAVKCVTDSPALAAFAPPVGAIGPLTVACLLKNTVDAASRRSPYMPAAPAVLEQWFVDLNPLHGRITEASKQATIDGQQVGKEIEPS